MSGGYVYIMSDHLRRMLYIGVTADLATRVYQHQQGQSDFTSRYGLTALVYYEHHPAIIDAIQREKNIKHWSRAWKISLIEKMNPLWADLSVNLLK